MKIRKTLSSPIIALTGLMLSTIGHTAECPVPPTSVVPSVQSKVEFDRNSGLYTYSYTVMNENNSPLPIQGFVVFSNQKPQEMQSPASWKAYFIEAENGESNVVWDTTEYNDPRSKIRGYDGPPLKLFYTIKPGQSLGGFSFKSPHPPGPVKYFAEGETGIPVSVPIEGGDDEPDPECPGFTEPRFTAMRGGVTEGPVAPGTLPVSIRLLDSKGGWRKREFNPDQDSGQIGLMVFPDRDVDPETLKVSSLTFGPGKAPVVSSKFVGSFKDRDEEWGDWERSCKKIHPDRSRDDEKARGRKKFLFLVFDVKKVGLRCDLDQALFLEGKTSDGKNVIGSVPVSTRMCKPYHSPKPKPKFEKNRHGKRDDRGDKKSHHHHHH